MTRAVHIVFALLLASSSTSPARAQTLSGEEILKRLEANFAGINDYTVSLDAKVDIERMKVPPMKATMYFKQPDKIHFVSEGFALLPKEGVGFNPSKLSERFDVESVAKDTTSHRYTLTVRPKSDRTRLRRVFLTVNPQTWTVEELLTPQFDGRQMRALFEYRRVEKYSLPSRIAVTFTSDTTRVDTLEAHPRQQRTGQIPRTGSISIRYSNYKINTGLTDDIFENRVKKE